MVVPLRTVQPGGDDTDLAVLRDVIGDARVVCLGESAHYCSELNRLRDRVLRFLVRELGFTTYACESGLPEGLAVDRWIQGDDDRDVGTVARTGISYAQGRCVEMHDQLRWMRAHRAGGGPLRFWGLDVPGDSAGPGPGVAAALARLGSRPGSRPGSRGDDAELLADADLGTWTADPYATGPRGVPAVPGDAAERSSTMTGLRDRIAGLLTRAQAAGDDVAEQCVRGALAVVELLEHGLYRGPGRNLRNEVMADTLRWLLRRDPDARVLVSAHTIHVQRSPSFDGTAPIGSLLDDELGADLVVIGTTRGSVAVPDVDLTADGPGRYVLPAGDPVPAPEGTLDALLDRAGPGPHLLDLRRADPDDLAGATAIQAAYGVDVPLDPRRAFDAVIHVRDVTPACGVADE